MEVWGYDLEICGFGSWVMGSTVGIREKVTGRSRRFSQFLEFTYSMRNLGPQNSRFIALRWVALFLSM